MLILFDHGTPRGIASYLPEHTVKEARAQGWDRLTNGELLKAAETLVLTCSFPPTKISAITPYPCATGSRAAKAERVRYKEGSGLRKLPGANDCAGLKRLLLLTKCCQI